MDGRINREEPSSPPRSNQKRQLRSAGKILNHPTLNAGVCGAAIGFLVFVLMVMTAEEFFTYGFSFLGRHTHHHVLLVPYSVLTERFLGRNNDISVLLAALQGPLYGALISIATFHGRGRVATLVVLGAHVIAVAMYIPWSLY